METRPDDLSDHVVADAVAAGWAVRSPVVAYLPVGFGSHHWSVLDASGRRWFASVDAAVEGSGRHARLHAALTTASVARDQGMRFVVAPERATSTEVTHPLGPRYVLALYPHVDGRTGSFYDDYDLDTARPLVERLATLHAATPALLHGGAHPDLAAADLPDRSDLEAALADAEAPTPAGGAGWDGPYGEGLRTALRHRSAAIRQALRRHDRAAVRAGSEHRRLVVTHGEPHPGNVIRTSEGPVLVDWDTARLATPERDLWHVTSRLEPDDAREVLALYTERTGRPVDRARLEHHRLAWALTDVASLVGELGHATTETADTMTAWRALVGTLEELGARHTSPAEQGFLGQEVTTRTSPADP